MDKFTKRHSIKLNYMLCDAVYFGAKKAEIRFNDRGYQKGDRIVFIPWDDKTGHIVGHPISDVEYEITYVMNGYGLDNGFVALSIEQAPPLKKCE